MNNDLATHIARESAALLLTKKIMNININSIISSRHQYINLKIINIVLFIFFFVFVMKKKKEKKKEGIRIVVVVVKLINT